MGKAMGYEKMLDVSHHNGYIDWVKVKKAGYVYNIIRAGYGLGNIDRQFRNNIKNAIAAGCKVGIYWFSYAYTVAMAKKEAEYCYNFIKDYNVTLPIFFDWEYDSEKRAKEHGVKITKSLMTNMTKAFCEYLKEKGYRVGYYYNRDYESRGLIDHAAFKKLGYYKWLARYTTTVQTDCHIHQYAEYGKVNGINSSAVDLNHIIDIKAIVNGEPVIAPVKETVEASKTDTTTPSTKTTYSKLQFIKDIQKIFGFKQTGFADKALLNKTITVSASRNNRHACVEAIQKYLKYVMKYSEVGKVDGEAGPKFTKAVKKYQENEVKIKPDGEITAKNKTWKKLLGLL